MQVAREVREEAGVEVENVHILGSQPWPIGVYIVLAHQCRFSQMGPCKRMLDPPYRHLRLLFASVGGPDRGPSLEPLW